MTWSQVPDHVRTAAEKVLTPKQLDAFKLWSAGVSASRIAIMVDISEPVARRRVTRALQLVKLELERKKVA